MAALALLVVWPAAASAEINIGESVQWLVASNDHVASGTITKVEAVKGELHWSKLTVKVAETFRGQHSDVLTFVAPHYHHFKWMTEPKAVGTQVLVFLADAKRPDLRLPKGGPWTWKLNTGGDGPLMWRVGQKRLDKDVPTMEGFKMLGTGPALLDAVRKSATFTGIDAPADTNAINLDVPWGTPVAGALYAGSAVWLRIPVDERAASMGRKLATSADVSDRVQAVHILGHFRSTQHERILRQLLKDEGTWKVTQNNVSTLRYPVREAAFKVLTQWGLKVKKPRFTAPQKP